MAEPGAVTLDLFGTLVDFSIQRDERPMVADLLEEAGQDRDPDEVLETWVRCSLAERARTPFRTVRESLVVGARETAKIHGIDVRPGYWASALETLWATRPLRDEALDAIEVLQDAEVDWVIVSNVDDPVLGALFKRTGLGTYVSEVVTSHRARAYKPHPRPFRMALDRLGVAPCQAVHVGDSAREDRAGARAAGMQSRLVDPETSLADVLEELVSP